MLDMPVVKEAFVENKILSIRLNRFGENIADELAERLSQAGSLRQSFSQLIDDIKQFIHTLSLCKTVLISSRNFCIKVILRNYITLVYVSKYIFVRSFQQSLARILALSTKLE